MKYAYEDLGNLQFERLIIALCQTLFGISVQGFSEGPDGGRDAKFVGKAERFPTTSEPWVGTTIIQAKHTNGINRSFSESDFYSEKSDTTILGKEIPRIKNLAKAHNLDNYIIFANRRLSANTESKMREYISTECNIPVKSIYICGIEQLDLWLKWNPNVATIADLDPLDSPLIISPDQLSDVIQALARQKSCFSEIHEVPPTSRTSFEKKNQINKMSKDYAKQQCKNYLKDTVQIHAFLAAPENYGLLKMYESIVEEFQLKIVAKRKDFQYFDDVMEYLIDLLVNRDAILRQRTNRRLTREMLFYMYWNCDIGKVDIA